MMLIALQVLLSGSRSIRKTFPSASKRRARTNPGWTAISSKTHCSRPQSTWC